MVMVADPTKSSSARIFGKISPDAISPSTRWLSIPSRVKSSTPSAVVKTSLQGSFERLAMRSSGCQRMDCGSCEPSAS